LNSVHVFLKKTGLKNKKAEFALRFGLSIYNLALSEDAPYSFRKNKSKNIFWKN